MSSLPIVVNVVTETNSTTYADELGVLIGLSRLPGEDAESYVKRLKTATKVDTSQDYVGLLNEITLQLGLSVSNMISLTSYTGNPLTVVCALTGIVLTDTITQATQTIPIVLVDIDNAWTWYLLSDIVVAVNSGSVATASLLVADGPTTRLAKQSNILTVIAQPITGQNVNLRYTGIIQSSIVFNISVPSYTMNINGTLIFSSPLPAGVQITYQRLVWPYSIIGGDVGILSLLDPAVQTMAQGNNGTIVYQVLEAVQTIVGEDLSYWAV